MIQNLTMFVSAFHFAESKEIEENLASPDSIWMPAEVKMEENIMHDYIQSAFYSATNKEMAGYPKGDSDLDFHLYSLNLDAKNNADMSPL